jgi:hypothetical protein
MSIFRGEDADHTNALQELQNIIGRWSYSSYFGYLGSLILSLGKMFLDIPVIVDIRPLFTGGNVT